MHHQEKIITKALASWLQNQRLNAFCTVSLKQGQKLCGTNGGVDAWRAIQEPDLIKTGMFLRDRFARKRMGKRWRKKLPFLTFSEGRGSGKRAHLHIITFCEEPTAFERFAHDFRCAAHSLIWTHKEIDIRPIISGEEDRVIKYCLKEGSDAFLPQASFSPE